MSHYFSLIDTTMLNLLEIPLKQLTFFRLEFSYVRRIKVNTLGVITILRVLFMSNN